MYKILIQKIMFLTLITSLFAFTTNAYAYQLISENDPNANISSPSYNAENDEVRINYATGQVKKHTIAFYHDANFTQAGTNATNTASNYFTGVGLTCVGWYIVTAYDENDDLVGEVRVEIEDGDLVEPRCKSESHEEPPPEEEGGGECEGCAILECPAWGDYMGKIDDILDAIPPPPNWNIVADTFRDSIAPQIKEDLQDVIGEAPAPPPAPKAPAPPSTPTVDIPDLPEPQGQESEGFKDSDFDYDDIKSEAPEIEFREDPTGGFNIGDPISDLPSQDEFKENIPEEGIVPYPWEPKEQENIAPTPPDTTDTAPMPVEEFDTPPVPSDSTDTAPMPTEDFDTPPMPGDTTDTAPIPGDTGDTAPIPNEEMIAPLPSGDSSTAPIPGDSSQFTAPIP